MDHIVKEAVEVQPHAVDINREADFMLSRAMQPVASLLKCCPQPGIEGVFKKKTEFLLYCSFYSILNTVPFKLVHFTGDTPFPTFFPLLECFLESTYCDGAQFSYCIFLNLLYGLETTSFQSGFKFGKQEKVCWG